MSGELHAFLAGVASGGPAWFLGCMLILWLGDLYDNRKGKRRDARSAALAAESAEREAHNIGDMANTLAQAGVEFNTQIAKQLIWEGWTK